MMCPICKPQACERISTIHKLKMHRLPSSPLIAHLHCQARSNLDCNVVSKGSNLLEESDDPVPKLACGRMGTRRFRVVLCNKPNDTKTQATTSTQVAPKHHSLCFFHSCCCVEYALCYPTARSMEYQSEQCTACVVMWNRRALLRSVRWSIANLSNMRVKNSCLFKHLQ